MKFLVTGGAGFIGSHFVRLTLQRHPEDSVVVFDKLTYAGNLNNVSDCQANPQFSFIQGDVCDASAIARAAQGCDAVLNFAAETHVDRSIQEAGEFVRTDVLGAYQLLEWARKNDALFLQVSTDEVYGSIAEGQFTEQSNFEPNSPYSASKAGAELIVRSYRVTYGLETLTTRSSNNYGPYQHPEKLIPRFVTNLLRGRRVPLYGDGLNVRDWLYVVDNCEAIDTVLRKGSAGQAYNIGADDERTNLELTQVLLKLASRGEEFIERVPDRLGHDRRYSINSAKVRALGWKPLVPFEQGIAQTVDWYKNNQAWWAPLAEP